jgi:hypothetical protein
MREGRDVKIAFPYGRNSPVAETATLYNFGRDILIVSEI